MSRALKAMAGIVVLASLPVFAEPGITTHYESIRQAFLHDTTEGVREHATRIQELAGDPEQPEELRRLLSTIRADASRLAETTTVGSGREAFGALSKSMVRYRQMTANTDSVVAFCSMAQQVWLQPKGQIGNPYYGQSMAGCGEIVSE